MEKQPETEQQRAEKRRARRSLITQGIVFVVVLYAVQVFQLRDAVGGQAPAMASTSLDGRALDVAALEGKPALVHFWATWCNICRMEQGNIEAVSRDFPVISVASWSGDDYQVEHHMRREHIDFPTVADNDGRWAAAYGVHGVPVTFVLDRHGQIAYIANGYTTELGLRIRLWLAGKS